MLIDFFFPVLTTAMRVLIFFFNFPPELASPNDGLHSDWFSRWVRAASGPDSSPWSVVTRHRAGYHLPCPVSRSQPKCVNVKEFPRSQNMWYLHHNF